MANEPTANELQPLPMGLEVPSPVRPGQVVTVVGTGFAAGEQVQVIMMSEPVVLTEVLADRTGAARATVTIPESATAGDHHLYMFGLTSRTGVGGATEVRADVVTAAANRPAALAFTGSSPAALLTIALVLVGLGLSLRFRDVRRSSR